MVYLVKKNRGYKFPSINILNKYNNIEDYKVEDKLIKIIIITTFCNLINLFAISI